FPQADLDVEEVTLSLMDANAEDIEEEEGMLLVTCQVEDFGNVQKMLVDLGIEPENAGLERLATTFKEVDDVKTAKSLMKLIDNLEEDDDVQKVYHNLSADDDLLAQL
ncbi:MAG: YebC/PmpR family DNA-binding transcriptional regulator, partial [Myxococcota bacterium]